MRRRRERTDPGVRNQPVAFQSTSNHGLGVASHEPVQVPPPTAPVVASPEAVLPSKVPLMSQSQQPASGPCPSKNRRKAPSTIGISSLVENPPSQFSNLTQSEFPWHSFAPHFQRTGGCSQTTSLRPPRAARFKG